jgi:hypothetical protein
MSWLATILSALVAGLGVIGVVWPDVLLEFGRSFATPDGLLAAAALRIVFGGSLLIAAQGSRAPSALRLIGIAILVAGLATPMIGVGRTRALLEAASANGGTWVRIAGTLAIALGTSLVFALSPRAGGPLRR